MVRAIDALLAGETFYGSASEGFTGEKRAPKPGVLFCQALAFA
jgi:hypothetical protein